jgi:hypothetical protein
VKSTARRPYPQAAYDGRSQAGRLRPQKTGKEKLGQI